MSDGTETEFALASFDLDTLIANGRYGQADPALDRLDEILPTLEGASDHEALLRGLSGRVCLLRLLQTPVPDLIIACDLLERAAEDRREPVWTAVARALRAQTHVDDGDIAAAMGDLGELDLDQLDTDLSGVSGYQLFDVLSGTYTRLRLHDRADAARRRIEEHIDSRTDLECAAHWVGWGVELTRRSIEPLASGAEQPELDLLDRAASIAAEITRLEPGVVPDRLLRASGGIRALAAAYREKPSEALRLLGKDAFADPRDLPAMERQVLTLAAMRSHALLGSIATARSLDESATRHVGTLFDTVLEVARARERLWLESLANGDVVPVLTRLTELLTRLAWQGMDLITDTARQSLEHHILRAESRTDALTGVGNRRALDEELRNMLRAGPLPLALVLVDVDGFKQVNDHFTHLVGDEVLRRVATALSQQLRLGDKILRYGGDEFVILLPGTADQEAQHVADRMSRAIARLPWSDLAEGLSIGITTGYASVWTLSGRRPEKDAEVLFRHADEALLAAKTARGQGRSTTRSQQWSEGGWTSAPHGERTSHPRPRTARSASPEASSWAVPGAGQENAGHQVRPSTARSWDSAEGEHRPPPSPRQPPYPPVSSFDGDPLASRTAADREITPPPEPGRSEVWSRPADPLTDPAWVDAAITGSLPLAAMTSAALEHPNPSAPRPHPERTGGPGPRQPRPRQGPARPSSSAPSERSPRNPESPARNWWQEPEPSQETTTPVFDRGSAPTRTQRARRRPSDRDDERSFRYQDGHNYQNGHNPGHGPQPEEQRRTGEPPAHRPSPESWYGRPRGSSGFDTARPSAPPQPPAPPAEGWGRPAAPGPPPPTSPGGWERPPAPAPPLRAEPDRPRQEPPEEDWADPWYRRPEENPPDPSKSRPPRRRRPPVIDFPGEDDPRTPFG